MMFDWQTDELIGPDFEALFGAALLGSTLLSTHVLKPQVWGVDLAKPEDAPAWLRSLSSRTRSTGMLESLVDSSVSNVA